MNEVPSKIMHGLGLLTIPLIIMISAFAGLYLTCKWIYGKVKAKPLATSLIAFGIILTFTCLGMYALRINDIPNNTSFEIKGLISYKDHGLFNDVNYLKYSVYPNQNTKPETAYRVIVGNNLVEFENKFIWSDLEIEVGKPFVVNRKLSPEEYSALKVIHTNIYVMQSERNVLLLFYPLIYGGIATLVMLRQKPKASTHSETVIEGEYVEL